MNWVIVWFRWVILLCIIIKWFFVSLFVVVKFKLLFKFLVILIWFLILKLNVCGLFYWEILILLFLFLFVGIDLCGKLGMFCVRVLIFFNSLLSFVLVVLSLLLSLFILVNSGVIFLFCVFVLLMDLFCMLCLFCRFCVLDWSVFFFFLSELKVVILRLKLWVVNCLVVCFILFCKYFGFNMCF